MLLQRPDVRQPEGQRPLHDLRLGTGRLALTAVVTLPIETGVVTWRGRREECHLALRLQRKRDRHTQRHLPSLTLHEEGAQQLVRGHRFDLRPHVDVPPDH